MTDRQQFVSTFGEVHLSQESDLSSEEDQMRERSGFELSMDLFESNIEEDFIFFTDRQLLLSFVTLTDQSKVELFMRKRGEVVERDIFVKCSSAEDIIKIERMFLREFEQNCFQQSYLPPNY